MDMYKHLPFRGGGGNLVQKTLRGCAANMGTAAKSASWYMHDLL